MAFKKTGHCEWTHEKTGVVVHKSTNPDAARKYYVVAGLGDDAVWRAAYSVGCSGGFFKLSAAKAAVEKAATSAAVSGR